MNRRSVRELDKRDLLRLTMSANPALKFKRFPGRLTRMDGAQINNGHHGIPLAVRLAFSRPLCHSDMKRREGRLQKCYHFGHVSSIYSLAAPRVCTFARRFCSTGSECAG